MTITPEELAALLKREYEAADNYHDQLVPLQNQAMAYYEAQPFGNEVEGRSQVILPDVQETIDYMVASILRTFVSGDRTVEFEATDEQDEAQADDATAAINYLFMRQQDGYRILHDGATDGLLKKIGIFKTVMETEEKVSKRRVILGADDILPEDVEIDGMEDNGDGTMTLAIRQQRLEKRFVDYAIPTSEFRFSPNARHEDEADYLCHVCEKTRSELVEMGFDQDQVYSLPAYSNFDTRTSENNSFDSRQRNEGTSPALERVLLCEEYAHIDMDDDGIAERVKVFRVENEVLIDAETGEPCIEEVDEQPFAVFCPFPRPHRLVGYSLAEKVMDIQLARSFVARQLFDGMALSNMPRLIIQGDIGPDGMSDILTPIPGSPIRGGTATIQPLQSSFDVGKSLQVQEWMTGERESRTGITRLNQGLGADTLNKTATGTALMQAQGQQQEEFVARNLAETLARLFAKKYRLMRKDGEPFRVKVDGAYKEIDPRQWPEDVNLIVRVGLGSGSKDKRIQYRMALLQPLMEGLQSGLSTPKNMFNLVDGLVRDMGVGQGDDYMVDPESEEGQQHAQEQAQKPDPETQAKQAELQIKGMEADAKIGLQRETNAANIEAMREKHALEMQLAREKAAQEAELARERMVMEASLEERRMHLDAAHKAELAKNRPGGALDA